ncbi:MAG: hypothetical protein D5R99_00500 [Methanocalculus sp. MSAO_Arc1]|uniref:hypothetical protein n=1 Tax=Methanocalculus TaxID=71151 RepID=UPI000FED6C51|nr:MULTISPECIES: hypothetical protein [unclassified Methanocalculus]MCP1661856.1 RPA family protein [Methanocalculus sp. AMF5]RQD81988.1 MAG: hypothetical protein D5R99_00500 [Methanocalculus sp. MSAO_Arc1]
MIIGTHLMKSILLIDMLLRYPVDKYAAMGYGTDPVSWIFADECHRAVRREEGFVTPTKAVLNRLFMIGVLTEVHVQSSRSVEARVSDPTGGLNVTVNRSCPLVADLLAATPPPAFVALAGELAQRGREEIIIIADALQIVERSDRDRYLHLCAEDTIRRLELAGDLTEEQVAIATMVKRALEVAGKSKENLPVAADPREQMIQIIHAQSGSNGALVADIFSAASDAGIGDDQTKTILTELLEEGECYMPTNDIIRLL